MAAGLSPGPEHLVAEGARQLEQHEERIYEPLEVVGR